MLNRLKFEVEFPPSLKFPHGQKLSGDHQFAEGMTAITGRNEGGKSLRLEMIRYALFGVAALRAKASDYKTLKVELEFEVAGKTYTVKRSLKNAILEQGDEPIATGTSPVNARIVKIFGYGLQVFDMANACLQGRVEDLGNLRPTERKAMVDQTIGLDALDKLIDEHSTERRALQRVVTSMEEALVRPEEPEKPEDYRPVVEIDQALSEAHELVSQRASLVATIQSLEKIKAPVEPQNPLPDGVTVEMLEEHEQKRTALKAEIAGLQAKTRGKKEPVPPENPCSGEEVSLEDLRRHQELRAQRKARIDALQAKLKGVHDCSPIDPCEIDRQRQLHQQHKAWLEKKRLLDRGELECPSCGHHWPVAAEELQGYEDVEECEPPEFTEKQLNQFEEFLDHSHEFMELEELKTEYATLIDATPIIEAVTRYQEQLRAYEAAAEAYREVQDDLATLATLEAEYGSMADYSAQLKAAQTYQHQMAAYEQQLVQYREVQAELARLRGELAKLPENPQETVCRLNGEKQRVQQYDWQKQKFDQELVEYERKVAELDDQRGILGELEGVEKGLKSFKLRVKDYLVPSLSMAASALLAKMTGGERSKIEVNSDFEILVDGQELYTLSGSGKAVANLAIRIALGQVLTRKAFNVFMGDEIDASMDEDRSQYTAECLRNLSNQIRQIFLVSHHEPEADHMIRV